MFLADVIVKNPAHFLKSWKALKCIEYSVETSRTWDLSDGDK